MVRPQDIVHLGQGSLVYNPNKEPLVLYGHGTRFTEQLGPRDFIIFGRNYKGHVARIVSDTVLEITHAIPHAEAGTYSFKIAPHVDQTAVYEEVHAYLNNHECITVFPEGGSHDRPEMLPLKGIFFFMHVLSPFLLISFIKAGFAVMALGALAENPTLPLKIVPVGMNYFHPDRFRSRAVVSFGQPMTIDPEEVEKFKRGGKERREAVTRLLDRSDEAFRTVTTNAPDFDTLMIIHAARRLYQNRKLSIQQTVKLNCHFVSGWTKLKEDPKLENLARKVKLYNETLAFFGIRDHQVQRLDITPVRASMLLIKRLCTLALLGGLGAPA